VSILADKGTRLLVQGITGRDGSFHTQQMVGYGTRVVGGVTPGRGGETVHGVPVFESVAEAVSATRANASVIYVPAAFAADAIYEAADAGIALIVCITEGVPVRDALGAWHHVAALRARNGRGGPRLVGPNCPGLISPGQSKVGIVPGQICKPGPIGVVSRSGTLTYEVVHQLTQSGLGQSTCVGIGGDPVIGTNFVDTLEMFENDAATDAIVLIGEIGGSDEEEAAQYIRRHVRKPVVAFVAGQTAPAGTRMGHAGAIISGGSGTAAEKMAEFEAAGVPVARIPSEIPDLIRSALERRRRRVPAASVAGARTRRTSSSRSERTARSDGRTRGAAGRSRRVAASAGRTKRSPDRSGSRRAAGGTRRKSRRTAVRASARRSR
jgi:succinyl-CoA synthetase alpha subunit